MLACRHPNRGDGPGDGGVAEHVVRARRLLDPVGVERREPLHPRDRLVDAPDLVGVHQQPAVGADDLPDDPGAALVVGGVAPDLHLQGAPTVADRRLRAPPHLLVGIAEPAGRGRVRRIAVLLHLPRPLLQSRAPRAEQFDRPLRGDRVREVAEGHAGHELVRRHVREQPPQRPASRALRSQSALTSAAVARCTTPFSGPSQRSCESPVIRRHAAPMSAVSSSASRPVTRRPSASTAATSRSVPRPIANVKP